jgi:AcrR family transcriptional regulator
VAAARRLFAERGFEHVSTSDVLEDAGVSRGAMYHHFPSKTDLFRAAWQASERDALARIGARMGTQPGTPLELLRAGCRAYLAECASSYELQRLGLLQSRSVLGWEGWSQAAAALGIGRMDGGVQAAVDSGELSAGDVETTARLLLAAMIEGGLLIATADDPEARFREVAPVAVRLIDGLRAETS